MRRFVLTVLVVGLIVALSHRATALGGPHRDGLGGKGGGSFPVSGVHPLDQLVAGMDPGEWVQIPNSDMDQTLLTFDEHQDIVTNGGGEAFWLNNNSDAVLTAWNSAAFDPEGNRWFFLGGGHDDYGGNEVYEYDFDTLQWTRLNDPAPLTVLHSGGTYVPEVGPISSHTYDGLSWNEATDTLWLSGLVAGYSSIQSNAVIPDVDEVWEFDPATLQWTAYSSSRRPWYPTSIYIPDAGEILVFHHIEDQYQRYAYSYDAQGTETALNSGAALSGNFDVIENFFQIPDSASAALAGRIFITDGTLMAEYSVDLSTDSISQVGSSTTIPNLGFHRAFAGYAFNSTDEKIYIWNGGRETYSWDPLADEYVTISNAASAVAPDPLLDGSGQIFDKWIYLENQGVFAGIHDVGDAGIWLWKPLSGPAVALDAATTETISVYLGGIAPASVLELYYRKAGDQAWSDGLEMFQSNNTDEGAQPYSGMVVGLEAGETYTIKVVEDGVDHFLTTATRSVPIVASTGIINVSTMAALQTAADAAVAGDLIVLAAGTYSGTLSITSRNGEDGNPITIRGAASFASIIDAGGAEFGVKIENCNYIHIEDLKIQDADVGVEIRDWTDSNGTIGNTVRGNFITDVGKGIFAKSNGWPAPGNDDLYIVDNVLEGRVIFPDTSLPTWDFEGIVFVSKGAEVAYNTISGFGDSISMSQSDENRGVDIHNNLVKWGGDDGIELDFCDRNCAAHHNLLSNDSSGVSFQFIDDGPAYAYRNVIYNVKNNVYKIKTENFDNDGIFIFNNTAINGSWAWINSGHYPDGLLVVNNLFTGSGLELDVLRLDSGTFTNTYMDYNAYIYDAYFQIPNNVYDDFADWVANSAWGDNDVMLAGETVFEWVTLDYDVNDFETWRDPEASGINFNLHSSSSAINAGDVIPGITEGYAGAAPDIGAYELGDAIYQYGVR